MADQPEVAFADVLSAMLNSKKYMLTSTLLMNTNGQMRPEAAEAYWAIVTGAKVTKFDIMKIIYMPTTGFNPFRNVTPGMSGDSARDETPARAQVRTELGEFESLLDDSGEEPKTAYEKIRALLRARRAGAVRRVVLDEDDDDDNDEQEEGDAASSGEAACGSDE